MVSVCSACKGLQKHLRSLESGIQETQSEPLIWLNTTLPSLRHSTNGGCRACSLLLQGILLHHDRFAGVPENNIRITAESFNPSASLQGNSAQDHLTVEVRWSELRDDSCDGEGDEHMHEHEEGYPDLKLEFFTDQGTTITLQDDWEPVCPRCRSVFPLTVIDGQSPFSAIGRGRHLSEHALKDGGLSTARALIKDCVSQHSSCRHQQPSTLPKRVLDVLLDDVSKGVRLHESDFNNEEQRYEFGEYLTLSHCWGSGRNVPKTTNKTLQSHKQNIPWSTLPRTYQDAIALTRSLGFRWLWIDSLCVIQDDASEKDEVSLHMNRIFGNSFLTIAATSAVDSNGGIFIPKPQLFKIQATDSKGSLHKIHVREQPSHYSFKASFDEGAHMNDWELPFNSSSEANLHTPLLKRAWAYVERLLSPRILHFTKSEMILECREGYQCECGRIDDPRFDSRMTDPVKQEFAKISLQSNSHGEANMGNSNDKRIDSMASQLAAVSLTDVTHSLSRKREEALQLWSYIITEYTARDLTYDVDRLRAIMGIAKILSEILQSGYIAGHWTFNTLGLLWYPKDGAYTRRPKGSSDNHIDIPSWAWASIEGSPVLFDNSTAMDLACSASFPSDRDRNFAWSPTSGDTLELTAAMATEVIFKIETPNEYSLVRNGVSVEFHPDVSSLCGEDSVSPGETLICVLVSMTFRSSIIGLVLKQSKSNAQLYRRVGRFECYECQKEGSGAEPDDAESLFEHWFPEVKDMGAIDDGPQRTFVVV